jgi:hypothetical protein
MTRGHRTALLAVSVLSCSILQSVVAAQQTPPPGQQTPQPAPKGGQQTTPAPARSESRGVTHGFSVVLVLADLQASAAPDDVPPAARRALADMKDFLPYKSYRLLDAAWILGQGTSGTVTRLRGPEEQEYELRMSTQHTPVTATRSYAGSSAQSGHTTTTLTGGVFVRFTLSEGISSEAAQIEAVLAEEARRAEENRRSAERVVAAQERSAEINRLEAELRAAEQQKNEARVKELRQALTRARNRTERGAQAPRPGPIRRHVGPIIDTTFNMDVGETVVVGTSRLKGNSRALIALLTAVPVKGSRLPTDVR